MCACGAKPTHFHKFLLLRLLKASEAEQRYQWTAPALRWSDVSVSLFSTLTYVLSAVGDAHLHTHLFTLLLFLTAEVPARRAQTGLGQQLPHRYNYESDGAHVPFT